MWRGAWSVPVVLLLTSTLAQAGTGMSPVHADIDYRLGALLEGELSTGVSSLLASVGDEKAPPAKILQLQAGRVEATIARTSNRMAIADDPPLLSTSRSIEGNDEEIEYRTYHDLSVHPVSTSHLWNVVAFARPGTSFDVVLPEGSYDLSQAPEKPTIVRPEVPRPKPIQSVVGPAVQSAANALEVRSSTMHAAYRGDFLLLLYGASFEFASGGQTERIDAGKYPAQYAVKGALVPELRNVNTSILLNVHDGVLDLESSDVPLVLYAREVGLDGRATFEQTTGTVTWGERSETADAASRVLEGQFRMASRGPAYERPDGGRFGPLTIEGFALAPIAQSPAIPPMLIAGAAGAVGLGAVFRWVPGARRLLLAAVAGFSLVQKNEALEHKARAQLYDYVRTNPGATLSVAQTHLGVGWGTVEYHVAVLERLGLLTTKRVGGKRLLFVAGQGRVVDARAWSLLRNSSVRQLGATLFAPGRAATAIEVAQALDCSPQYAGRLLRKLAEAGLVAPAESDRRAYAATDLFHDLARRTGLVAPAQEAVPLEAPLPA